MPDRKSKSKEAERRLRQEAKTYHAKDLVRGGNMPKSLSPDKHLIILSFDNMSNNFTEKDTLRRDDSGKCSSELLKIIADISRETWFDAILKTQYKWAGCESVPKNKISIKNSDNLPVEVDKWMIFRYNEENSRLVGYKYDDDDTYHITHIDPDMNAYPHGS